MAATSVSVVHPAVAELLLRAASASLAHVGAGEIHHRVDPAHRTRLLAAAEANHGVTAPW